MLRLILSRLAGLMLAGHAAAFSVGERHMTANVPSAAVRDAEHRTRVRMTVWYPAAAGAVEVPLDIGPPAAPLFKPGSAAPDAAFADDKARPVVLLSHGFGGTAQIMGWFGTALAREGYIVIAVDHPGNNGIDPMTVPGAILFWERPGDLAAALSGAEADPSLASHLDLSRLGVAGFSAGGFTALAAAGGRVDLDRYRRFGKANPTDGVCAPQKEFSISLTQAEAYVDQPEMAAELARSKSDLAIPGVRAVFAMAPAIVQAFDPRSLTHLKAPVSLILGEVDQVAPPATNGLIAARLIPHAQLKALPNVGHYDFLAECTAAGDATVAVCPTKTPRTHTHRIAIEYALSFFDRTLNREPR